MVCQQLCQKNASGCASLEESNFVFVCGSSKSNLFEPEIWGHSDAENCKIRRETSHVNNQGILIPLIQLAFFSYNMIFRWSPKMSHQLA